MVQRATSGGDQRAARRLDDPVMGFDLGDEVERLRAESGYTIFGRSSITLGKGEHARMVLSAVRAGSALGNPHADAAMAIEVLDGQVRVGRDGGGSTYGAGSALWLAEGGAWEVEATRDAAVLLTLGWPGSDETGTDGN